MTRLLIVDDHPSHDCALGSALSEKGYQVYVAGERTDGIKIASSYKIDIILCNLENPRSGERLVKELQCCDATETIPIFYISAVPDLEVMRRMMSLGADDFFVVPVDVMGLIQAIEKRLKKRKALEDKINRAIQTSFEGEGEMPGPVDHFIVTIGCRLKFIKFSDVVCILAQKEYSLIKTKDLSKILVRRSLRQWMRLLPSNIFLRIHRSTIINIEAIEKLTKLKDRSYVVYLKGIEEPFPLSQRFMNIMRRTFPVV